MWRTIRRTEYEKGEDWRHHPHHQMYDADGRDTQAAKYAGRTGTVEFIDSIGQLHGTWGGLAIIPEVDEFEIASIEKFE